MDKSDDEIIVVLVLRKFTTLHFGANFAIARGTHAYIATRIFADVAQGKWRPKFPKSFMLFVHNSMPSWLLEFC